MVPTYCSIVHKHKFRFRPAFGTYGREDHAGTVKRLARPVRPIGERRHRSGCGAGVIAARVEAERRVSTVHPTSNSSDSIPIPANVSRLPTFGHHAGAAAAEPARTLADGTRVDALPTNRT